MDESLLDCKQKSKYEEQFSKLCQIFFHSQKGMGIFYNGKYSDHLFFQMDISLNRKNLRKNSYTDQYKIMTKEVSSINFPKDASFSESADTVRNREL